MRKRCSLLVRRVVGPALLLPLVACGPSDPGERVWVKKCAGCHGVDGRGQTTFAAGRPFSDLTDGRWKHGGDPESIRKLIADGEPKSPMPAFAGRLSKEEIDAVVRYVLTLAGPKRAAP